MRQKLEMSGDPSVKAGPEDDPACSDTCTPQGPPEISSKSKYSSLRPSSSANVSVSLTRTAANMGKLQQPGKGAQVLLNQGSRGTRTRLSTRRSTSDTCACAVQQQKLHKLPVHSTTLAQTSVRRAASRSRLTVFWKLAVSLEIASLICHIPAFAKGTYQENSQHVKALVREQLVCASVT